MKKIFLAIIVSSFFLPGCAVFRKKEKLGCPVAGSSIGAEQLSDPAKLKKSEKSKFKVKDMSTKSTGF